MSDLSLASRPYFYLAKTFQILAQFNLTIFLTNSNVAQIFTKISWDVLYVYFRYFLLLKYHKKACKSKSSTDSVLMMAGSYSGLIVGGAVVGSNRIASILGIDCD